MGASVVQIYFLLIHFFDDQVFWNEREFLITVLVVNLVSGVGVDTGDLLHLLINTLIGV